MPTTLSRSPTHPWPKVLKLRLSPKGARFRVGERVKGQLKLTSYGYATGYEFHLTYYRSIETDSLTRRMALGHLVMTSEHFKVDGVGVFGFPQRVDALPFQSGHFTLSDYVELTVHRTGSQDIVYRQSKPLIVRNSGVTYRPRSARLHLTGQRIDEGALPLLSMVTVFLLFFGLSDGSRQVVALIISAPLLIYFFHRWLQYRRFARASLHIGDTTADHWLIKLEAPHKLSLVDAHLTLRVRKVYRQVDREGQESTHRTVIYRHTVHAIDALLPPTDSDPDTVTVAFPKPDRVLPPSTIVQDMGVEWQLLYRHQPTFWLGMQREWNLRVSLAPR